MARPHRRPVLGRGKTRAIQPERSHAELGEDQAVERLATGHVRRARGVNQYLPLLCLAVGSVGVTEDRDPRSDMECASVAHMNSVYGQSACYQRGA